MKYLKKITLIGFLIITIFFLSLILLDSVSINNIFIFLVLLIFIFIEIVIIDKLTNINPKIEQLIIIIVVVSDLIIFGALISLFY